MIRIGPLFDSSIACLFAAAERLLILLRTASVPQLVGLRVRVFGDISRPSLGTRRSADDGTLDKFIATSTLSFVFGNIDPISTFLSGTIYYANPIVYNLGHLPSFSNLSVSSNLSTTHSSPADTF